MTEEGPAGQLPLALALEDHALFETFFLPGQGALLAAARDPQPPGLWIAGPRGSGKSHLLQAMCAHRPERPVAYVSLATAPSPAMLEGLESMALVCLDDLQAVAGADEWEHALFRLVNGASLAGATLAVAATGAPAELGIRLPDLLSRCQALTRFRLRPLDDEERVDALRARAAFRGFDLPEDTARYLLRRVPRDMHRLTALLDRLDAASLAASRRLTIPFVREVLGGA
ncbi:MAG: DnaA regulatory inactivator Hda [Gammaproteobacteria bacterium]|jgi:DnaA family protein